MALIPSARYPGQIDVAAAYPQGKARNAGSFQDGTGTPLEKDWVNDSFGFQQALLAEAAIVPSGNPDAVGASQYLDALLAIAERKINRQQLLKGWHAVRPTTTPTSLSLLGAVRDPTRALALISTGNANGTLRVRSEGQPATAGDIGTSGSGSIASDPSATNLVATHGLSLWCYRSTNQGGTWTVATTKPASDGAQVVWGNGTFLARGSGVNLYTSPTGDVWTSRTGGGLAPRSLAATRTGATEYLIVANQNSLFVSGDSGVTWAAGGVLPDAALHVGTTDGFMASTAVGSELIPFFLANISDGSAYRLYRGAANGTGWTLVSTLPIPADLVGDDATVKLLGDRDTGALLAILATNTKGTYLFLSLDAGVTWHSWVNVDVFLNAIAMAAGRIFLVNARGISMSDFEAPLL